MTLKSNREATSTATVAEDGVEVAAARPSSAAVTEDGVSDRDGEHEP